MAFFAKAAIAPLPLSRDGSAASSGRALNRQG